MSGVSRSLSPEGGLDQVPEAMQSCGRPRLPGFSEANALWAGTQLPSGVVRRPTA
jgi:hypothetical protein